VPTAARPEWGRLNSRRRTHFKLSQHKDWLPGYLDNRADAVIPDFRQKELRNAVEKISDNRQSGSTFVPHVPNHDLTGE
jgi:hypothetical protein